MINNEIEGDLVLIFSFIYLSHPYSDLKLL